MKRWTCPHPEWHPRRRNLRQRVTKWPSILLSSVNGRQRRWERQVANYEEAGGSPTATSENDVAGAAAYSTYRRQRQQAHLALPRASCAEHAAVDEGKASEPSVAGVLAYRADTTESSPASAGRGRAESKDPRHLFLDAKAVMQRYGWGKTKGYQNLKNRELVPPPVMTHPDRWRLDQLLAWEDLRIASASIDLVGPHGPSGERLEVGFPAPKRVRRKSA